MSSDVEAPAPTKDDLQTEAHKRVLEAWTRVEAQSSVVDDAINRNNSTLVRLKHAIDLQLHTEQLVEALIKYKEFRP